MPKRIQRKRTKGWKMPKNAVYVGRPSKWGNPFHIGVVGGVEQSIEMYREYMAKVGHEYIQNQLRGKDLVCWCPPDQPCHADVLLKIANEITETIK